MDNFAKLGLKVTQTEGGDENKNVENAGGRKLGDDNAKIGLVDERADDDSNGDKQKIAELKGKIFQDFKALFTTNNEIKNFEYDVAFKENMEIFQQKGRRIPIHLQNAVEIELKRLQIEGHLEKLEEIGENVCVSPAVVAQKSDGSIKIALDAEKLNKRIVKKKCKCQVLTI